MSVASETIARLFLPSSVSFTLQPIGNGLINDTYLVEAGQASFILQRVNTRIFQQPDLILSNLRNLGESLNKSAIKPRLRIPQLLPTLAGDYFALDEQGAYWRAMEYIPASMSKEQCENLADARQIGWALGHFHVLCSCIDQHALHDTLPGFHITPEYFRSYQNALAGSSSNTEPEAYSFCQKFIAERETNLGILENANLKRRVMHGDPKVNNFLFDHSGSNIISLIDLDTVKPGLWHYDLGDCIRSVCGKTDSAIFDLELCDAILDAYLAETHNFLSEADVEYVYAAIRLIPLELGLRFFTDYLNGNVYFKVNDPLQNLERAVEQFKLCAQIEALQPAIQQMIAKHANR